MACTFCIWFVLLVQIKLFEMRGWAGKPRGAHVTCPAQRLGTSSVHHSKNEWFTTYMQIRCFIEGEETWKQHQHLILMYHSQHPASLFPTSPCASCPHAGGKLSQPQAAWHLCSGPVWLLSIWKLPVQKAFVNGPVNWQSLQVALQLQRRTVGVESAVKYQCIRLWCCLVFSRHFAKRKGDKGWGMLQAEADVQAEWGKGVLKSIKP